MSLPIISEDTQRGNYAEHQAATWLSRQCLVRPVTSGTDIGVDLYCESLAGDSPFQHFWVQVKAISERNIRQSDAGLEAFFDFETRHLRYWIRQPVPVYAFLVPVPSWPPAELDTIFGVNISRNLLMDGIPDQEWVRYTTTDCFEAATLDEDLTQFITRVVPVDSAILLLPHGVIAAIEFPEERAETHLPQGFALRYFDTIENTIRLSLEIGLAELLIEENLSQEDHERRQRISRILSEYDNDLNAIGASILAQSACIDGDFERAMFLFDMVEDLISDAPVDENVRALRLTELQRQRAICDHMRANRAAP
jgi:hypothetical protein